MARGARLGAGRWLYGRTARGRAPGAATPGHRGHRRRARRPGRPDGAGRGSRSARIAVRAPLEIRVVLFLHWDRHLDRVTINSALEPGADRVDGVYGEERAVLTNLAAHVTQAVASAEHPEGALREQQLRPRVRGRRIGERRELRAGNGTVGRIKGNGQQRAVRPRHIELAQPGRWIVGLEGRFGFDQASLDSGRDLDRARLSPDPLAQDPKAVLAVKDQIGRLP